MSRTRSRIHLALLSGLFGFAALAVASAVSLDPKASRFSVVFTQMGVPVEAEFRRVDATIAFDPAAPEQARAEVTVAVDSFDLGDPSYNQEILKPEWFDAAQYPTARFVTDSVEATGDQLVAHGKLTVKGHTEAVSVPLQVSEQDGLRLFSGEFPISRLAYGIGANEWKDTDLVADQVIVRFRAATTQ